MCACVIKVQGHHTIVLLSQTFYLFLPEVERKKQSSGIDIETKRSQRGREEEKQEIATERKREAERREAERETEKQPERKRGEVGDCS